MKRGSQNDAGPVLFSAMTPIGVAAPKLTRATLHARVTLGLEGEPLSDRPEDFNYRADRSDGVVTVWYWSQRDPLQDELPLILDPG